MSINHKNGGETGLASNADEASERVSVSPSPHAAKGRLADADKAVPDLPDAAPHDGKGRPGFADKTSRTMPDPPPEAAKGHTRSAAKAVDQVPDAAPKAEAGLSPSADKAVVDMPASALDALAELQVRRKFYIGTVNKSTNAIKALVRRALGWRYDEEEVGREKINKRATRIVAAALAGKEQKSEDAETYAVLAFDLATVAAAIEPCTKARHEIELEMKRIARKLSIFAAWAKDVKGLGELGLAVILAEAGDLSGYLKKGHLWKRLGLAPHEGKAMSTWRRMKKGGLSADEWTEAGYSPRRLAEIWSVVSEPLLRAQSVAKGPYRAIYDRRRERTAVAHSDWTKAHSHADGLRIMTKYLLRDLWQEWNRRVAIELVPTRPATVCLLGDANGRKAEDGVPEVAVPCLPTVQPIGGAP